MNRASRLGRRAFVLDSGRAFAWRRATVVVLAAVWPALAHADVGERALREGRAAFDAGRMDEATRKLEQASRELAPQRVRERAEALLFRGVAEASLGRMPAAREAWRGAFLLEPEVSIPRQRVPPAFLMELDAVRQSLEALLEVQANEVGAAVYVDGRRTGVTPVSLRLSFGRHHLRVVSVDGLRAFDAPALRVDPLRTTRVSAKLSARLARLELSVKPAGARIQLDDGTSLVAPAALHTAAGPRRVTVRAARHHPLIRDLTLLPETTTRLDLALEPQPPRPWYQRRRPWAWLTGGLAGLSGAAALVLGHQSRVALDRLVRETTGGLADGARYDELLARSERHALGSNVLLGVSAASALASLLLFVTARSDSTPSAEAAPRASLGVSLSSAGIALEGAF